MLVFSSVRAFDIPRNQSKTIKRSAPPDTSLRQTRHCLLNLLIILSNFLRSFCRGHCKLATVKRSSLPFVLIDARNQRVVVNFIVVKVDTEGDSRSQRKNYLNVHEKQMGQSSAPHKVLQR